MVTLKFAESLQSGSWSLTSASGSSTEPADASHHYPGCSATLSRNGPAAGALGSFGPNVVTRRVGYWTAELFPPTYWGVPSDPVSSSETIGDCATSARVDYAGLSHSLGGAECHFDPSAGNTEAIDFPVGSSYTVQDNCSGTITSNGVDYDVSLQSSVTFASPGVVSPGSTGPTGSHRLPYGPFFPKAKADARSDLRMHAVPNAVQYCLPFATGSLLAGAGVIVSGLPGGAGITLTVAGGLTASAAAPFCAATVKRVVVDYRTFNDPPRRDVTVIARPAPAQVVALPSCTGFRGAAARLCMALRSAESRWVNAAEVSESVAAAIEMTVSREHAAAMAGQQSALNAQDAALKALLADRQKTTTAEASAGRAVAGELRGANLQLRLTQAQAAQVIALVKSRIAAQGVPAVNVIGLDEANFKPSAHDLLAGLGSL